MYTTGVQLKWSSNVDCMLYLEYAAVGAQPQSITADIALHKSRLLRTDVDTQVEDVQSPVEYQNINFNFKI